MWQDVTNRFFLEYLGRRQWPDGINVQQTNYSSKTHGRGVSTAFQPEDQYRGNEIGSWKGKL